MNYQRSASITLSTVGLVFLAVALQGFLVPVLFMAPMEIDITTASGHAEVRAGYGGCFGGLAFLYFHAARRPQLMLLALRVASIVLGIFVSGRLLSWGIDGSPNLFSMGILMAESLGFVACAFLLSKLQGLSTLAES